MSEPKVRRIRVSVRLSVPLRSQLAKYSAASGLSERAVIENALRQLVDASGAKEITLRRFELVDRALARQQRELELLGATLGLYLRAWLLAHQTSIAEASKDPEARKRVDVQYKHFMKRLAEAFFGGHRLADDLRAVGDSDGAQTEGPSPAHE